MEVVNVCLVIMKTKMEIVVLKQKNWIINVVKVNILMDFNVVNVNKIVFNVLKMDIAYNVIVKAYNLKLMEELDVYLIMIEMNY